MRLHTREIDGKVYQPKRSAYFSTSGGTDADAQRQRNGGGGHRHFWGVGAACGNCARRP
jgi:hypothetical protein